MASEASGPRVVPFFVARPTKTPPEIETQGWPSIPRRRTVKVKTVETPMRLMQIEVTDVATGTARTESVCVPDYGAALRALEEE